MPRLRSRLGEPAFALLGAGIAANALRLRARVQGLAVVDTAAAPSTGPGSAPGDAPGERRTARAGRSVEAAGFSLVSASGVVVDDATAVAAVGHAEACGLDVVDLVPGDLPSTRLIELATHLDPRTYRHDRLAIGWGAGHAAVVRTAVLERIGRGSTAGTVVRSGLDPVAYLRLARQCKRYAPGTTDLAVAPDLVAVDPHPSWRHPYLRALLGVTMPVLAPGPAVGAVLAGGAPLPARCGGSLALAAHLVEPHLVAGAGPVRPRDLRRSRRSTSATVGGLGVADHGERLGGRPLVGGAVAVATALTRPLRDVTMVVRRVAGRRLAEVRVHDEAVAAADRAARRAYADAAARSGEHVEPRRSTCPWCGADDVVELHTLPDLIQGKPGTFRLDRCRACTHVFQNPRLSVAGLDYYYRDFYDGLQAEHTELLFSFTGASYLGRARMLERVVDTAGPPRRWLDVGTGHGHFCRVARDVWPGARFDGLDMTDSIDEAERRGWVERGHRGLFPDLAPGLTGGYDVLSMHHYLEHTRDPARELDAARAVLEPGGHLLVELPAPESPFGRWLGWAWGRGSNPSTSISSRWRTW